MNDSLLEKCERYGGFWLPSNDKQIVSGQLKFDPDGSLELILSDDLNDGSTPFPMFQRRDHVPIILGRLANGTPVTLTNGLPLNWKCGLSPGGPSTFLIGMAFLGTHFTAIEDLRILSFEASFTLLEQWAAHTNMLVESVMAPDGLTQTGWSIHCNSPVDETFKIAAKSTSITLSQHVGPNINTTEVTVKPVSFFNVVPSSAITFEEANDLKWNLQNLLTLLTGYAVAPRFFNLQVDARDARLQTHRHR